MFYVYVLQSGGHRYVGKTSDLKRRLTEHNTGKNRSTKAFRPWELIFYEAYIEVEDATRREAYLKTTQGRRALANMLKTYYDNHRMTVFPIKESTTGKED